MVLGRRALPLMQAAGEGNTASGGTGLGHRKDTWGAQPGVSGGACRVGPGKGTSGPEAQVRARAFGSLRASEGTEQGEGRPGAGGSCSRVQTPPVTGRPLRPANGFTRDPEALCSFKVQAPVNSAVCHLCCNKAVQNKLEQ